MITHAKIVITAPCKKGAKLYLNKKELVTPKRPKLKKDREIIGTAINNSYRFKLFGDVDVEVVEAAVETPPNHK